MESVYARLLCSERDAGQRFAADRREYPTVRSGSLLRELAWRFSSAVHRRLYQDRQTQERHACAEHSEIQRQSGADVGDAACLFRHQFPNGRRTRGLTEVRTNSTGKAVCARSACRYISRLCRFFKTSDRRAFGLGGRFSAFDLEQIRHRQT